MARNLIEDYGAFDNNAEKGGRNDAGSLIKRLFSFLTNRYPCFARSVISAAKIKLGYHKAVFIAGSERRYIRQQGRSPGFDHRI